MTEKVVSLYRACFRCVRKIPSDDQRRVWADVVRLKFVEGRGVRDKVRKERLLRHGWEEVKQMDYYHQVRELQCNKKVGFDRVDISTEVANQVANVDKSATAINQNIVGRLDFVGNWLVEIIPNLTEDDRRKYAGNLVSEGFDSLDLLALLTEDDLSEFRVGHRRAIMRKFAEARCKNT
ncbi:unnamed protein product [Choristocarpus tenellus]